MSVRILVVDNHDSFVFNLVQYLHQLGARCEVLRNDEVRAGDVRGGFAGVLLSPGPGAPERAGACIDVVRGCAAARVPLLGVCLGMQAMAAAYGGAVRRAPEPRHGTASQVAHSGAGLFAGLPSPFAATRYHSLAVDRASLGPELAVTAWTGEGVVMGLRHRRLPLEGVQFHPESVLTEWGHRMLANWLVRCGDTGAPERAEGLAPVVGA